MTVTTNSIEHGGPAFPPAHDPATHPSGMTLRDYFAAQAMQALIHTRATLPEDSADGFQTINFVGWGEQIDACDYTHAESLVHDAYFIAGQMLKERERQ
jgi:hypothetical protein